MVSRKGFDDHFPCVLLFTLLSFRVWSHADAAIWTRRLLMSRKASACRFGEHHGRYLAFQILVQPRRGEATTGEINLAG